MKSVWFTKMNADGTINVPLAMCSELGLKPGKKLLWLVTEEDDDAYVELLPNLLGPNDIDMASTDVVVRNEDVYNDD